MGAQGAVNILYRKELAEAADDRRRGRARAELIAEYEDTLANPYIAAERGYIDAVIAPARDPRRDRPGAAAAAHQAGDAAAQEAREHPAVSDDEQRTPLLRVVKGDATPEEVAALVAVLLGVASGGCADAEAAPRPEWSAPHRTVRRPLLSGPGGWRSSALPR